VSPVLLGILARNVLAALDVRCALIELAADICVPPLLSCFCFESIVPSGYWLYSARQLATPFGGDVGRASMPFTK
jgi:hypothetical protein